MARRVGPRELTLGPWRRRRDARKHLVADPDEPLTDQSLLFGWVMHDRLRARPLVGLVALLIVPTAVTGLVANPSPALAGAGALGVVVAAWVARGLRRRLPQRPEQPARRLVDLVPRQVALVVVLGAGGLVLTVVEALNVAGTDFSTLVTPVALVVLPGAVVAWRYTVRTAGGLAAADVLHIALTGEAPLVDTYRESLVPALVATD